MMTGTVGSRVTGSKRRFLNRTSSFSEVRKSAGGASRPTRRSFWTVDEKLPPREGLRDVVVGSRLHAGDQVADLVLDRQHRDRDLARLRGVLQRRADFPARELRHHDVEEDQVGLELEGDLDALPAVARGVRGIASAAQDRLDDQQNVVVVVDDENLLAGHRCRDLSSRGVRLF